METKRIILFISLLLMGLFLTNCEKKEDVKPKDNTTTPPVEEEYNYDYFPYFTNSVFQFNVKAKDSKGETFGKMSLFVESFDETKHTAKIIISKNFNKNLPAEDYFFVRKTKENTLEFSRDGVAWNLWLDCETLSTDFTFLLTGPVGKPSNLLGSVETSCKSSSISTSAGSFSTIKIDAAYDNSSYDDYVYDDQGTEHFDVNVGLVHSYMLYVDWSMGYPYNISMNRTIELAGYKIYKPNGSTLETGEIEDASTTPIAPENLIGERTSITSVKITWEDKSLNESGFQIERKELGANDYEILSTTEFNVNEYIDNSVEETTRYEYRINAINSAGESDYSNEIAINLYGVPEAPWDPSGGYNKNMNFLFLMWWARYSDNITHFKIAYPDGDNWVDYEFDVNSVPDDVYDDKWLQNTRLYYNGGQAWPAGIYQFRIKAVNSYGESYYSEVIEVNPYAKKSTNEKIDYKLIQFK